MKSLIIGTAGHIDHGKTALVKALTGIDADRLAEEKRRGITIDLGFAYLTLPTEDGSTLQIGFVDVPGHERFVRNMLAGVGGIDLVLLVIAADESIKPQTREHFDILQLLGVKRGITVLTKSDAVDAETLDVVRLEVEDFLRGTFLERSPIVSVSSLTGAGLENLKHAIIAAAAHVEARDAQALPRLPIDRVFTMKGFGTVVTGTLISGTVRREDELEAFPSGKNVRVRGVQVHGQTADQAIAGQRTALNLAGVSTEELSRGMMLAPATTFEASRRADVRLMLLASAARPLKNRSRAHFHCNTMESVAEILLYDCKELAPGAGAFARLKLPAPALLLPGDRFIIRQFSPVITIGGGTILDAAPEFKIPGLSRVKRTAQASASALSQGFTVLESGQHGAILTFRTTRRGKRGLSIAEAVSETGLPANEIIEYAHALADEKMLVRFQDRLFAEFEFGLAQKCLLDRIAQLHKEDPLKPGIARGEIHGEMKRIFGMAPELFDAAVTELVMAKKVETTGDLLRLPGQGVVMKDEEAESKKKIEDAFATAGLKVPALNEVLAGLKIDKARAQKIVTLLLRDKSLIKVSDDLVFHRSALDQLRGQIAAHKSRASTIDVAAFKNMTGVSRKYAIPLLEYLDRERVTRRIGDSRQIL